MKILKKLVLIFVAILVIIIYITNKDNKIYYVSLGDGLSSGINAENKKLYGYSDYISEYLNKTNKLEFYTKEFSNENLRTTDIINNINNNIEISIKGKKITIKKALMKSDIITLSTGLNEILYKLENSLIEDHEMYQYIDELEEDIHELIDIIKKYCKEDIMILGYYNPFQNVYRQDNNKIDNLIKYANNKLIDLCNLEKIYYIDLYNLFQNNKKVFTNKRSYYPNLDGYKLISNEIIYIIEKNIVKSTKTL